MGPEMTTPTKLKQSYESKIQNTTGPWTTPAVVRRLPRSRTIVSPDYSPKLSKRSISKLYSAKSEAQLLDSPRTPVSRKRILGRKKSRKKKKKKKKKLCLECNEELVDPFT